MKTLRFALASLFIMASVFRSLPDTVFDLFHEHQHAFNLHTDDSGKEAWQNQVHFCHIADWNYEAFENAVPLYTMGTPIISLPSFVSTELTVIGKSVPSIGRAPPVA